MLSFLSSLYNNFRKKQSLVFDLNEKNRTFARYALFLNLIFPVKKVAIKPLLPLEPKKPEFVLTHFLFVKNNFYCRIS